MTGQFKEQGGVATMDPNPLYRWLASRIMTRVSRPERLAKRRAKIEQQRIKSGGRHVVEYFHQVEDAYSHLAAQVLNSLAARYDIELVCHLVGGPTGKNAPEPELLLQLARYDAYHVAPHYGLEFPEQATAPRDELLAQARAILAAQDSQGFAACAAEVGRALWADDAQGLSDLAEEFGTAAQEDIEASLAAGDARREELHHYSGAMFYYAEEWYWGVDRLYHLEQRLSELGADNHPGQQLLMPRPDIEPGERRDRGSLTFEFYPSLRSPYTAVIFDRAIKLARDTGVKLVVRPVLPMVMRGVPATRQKGMYIFTDAAREAREAGVPYGNFYDPIGEPARRCYSLYPWACEQDKGIDLLSSFLSAAFAGGINTNNDKGLRTVVEKAGLDWDQAKAIVGRPDWEAMLEENRLAMYEAGLWGVPSFRLLDEKGKQLLALWGQDRLWLFAREIQRHLAQDTLESI
jgi:2-hydroxychromene-2-carboxylate isomerase